jgi:hypothetical protein
MVERDAPGIALAALHQRSPSSEETYQQGVVHFITFMDENELDRHLLQHGKDINHLIILSFIKYLRSRTVFDANLLPPRHRPITAGYIDSCTTHVVKFVERSNADLASTLRSRDSAALINAYKHNDTIIRGPLDSYCPIPLGCEFVALALRDIDIMFCNDPATRALYRKSSTRGIRVRRSCV